MSPTVSGVGSLPHDDADAAARFVLATTDVPYLAQLPARHPEEGMVRQWGDGLCGCGATDSGYGLGYGAAPGPRHEAFGGAGAVLDAMSGTVVKTQATGPVTLAAALLAAGHPGRGLWSCVVDGLVARIAEHVAWIGERRPGSDVVLVLDEPTLGAVAGVDAFPISPAAAASALRAVMDSAPVRPGIHCCGEPDWAMVAGLGPSWLSWDVVTLGRGLEDAEAVAAAIAAGTGVMWGVAPAAPLPVAAASAVMDAFAVATTRLIVAGAPAGALLDGAWYTPACGLAGLGIEQASWVMDEVRRVAAGVTR